MPETATPNPMDRDCPYVAAASDDTPGVEAVTIRVGQFVVVASDGKDLYLRNEAGTNLLKLRGPDISIPSKAEQDEMGPNQHDPSINAESTRLVLLRALEVWEKGACECCSPTVLDDAIDRLGYEVPLWERMRKMGIELAQTAQNVIDLEAQDH